MKLYTEEQVHKALELLLETGKHNNLIIQSLTPIELPTEKEIDKISRKILYNYFKRDWWAKGAKWLIQHITSQINK